MSVFLNLSSRYEAGINTQPEGFLPLTIESTAESSILPNFIPEATTENLYLYLFYQFSSLTTAEPLSFERLIQADPKDSYFVKVNKAFQYLNKLRENTELEPILLPKEEGNFPTSLLSFYKEGYQEVVDKNLILFWEGINNPEVNEFIKQNANLPLKEKTLALRNWTEENPRVYDCTMLDLRSQGLTEIPYEIGNFKNLHTLELSGNQLALLPESMETLEHLTMLNLKNNHFEIFPESIFKLTNLKTLILRRNSFMISSELLNNLNQFLPNSKHDLALPDYCVK